MNNDRRNPKAPAHLNAMFSPAPVPTAHILRAGTFFLILWFVLKFHSSLQAADEASATAPLQRIYITHFAHTDFGFTDLQTVCRELQRRYLDVALDSVRATMN